MFLFSQTRTNWKRKTIMRWDENQNILRQRPNIHSPYFTFILGPCDWNQLHVLQPPAKPAPISVLKPEFHMSCCCWWENQTHCDSLSVLPGPISTWNADEKQLNISWLFWSLTGASLTGSAGYSGTDNSLNDFINIVNLRETLRGFRFDHMRDSELTGTNWSKYSMTCS